jgi:DNA-binding NtrC family response regulator
MATVLYIDDEEPIRRAVRSWLTRKGHVVHEADSAAAARTVIEAHPDLQGVFIDLRLGDESGLDLFGWLAQHHPALARRAVFVTGGEEPPPTGDAAENPVIGKPFEMRTIERQAAAWDAHAG